MSIDENLTLQPEQPEAEESKVKAFLAFIGVFLMVCFGMGMANGTYSLYTQEMADVLGVARTTLTVFQSFGQFAGMIISILFLSIYKKAKPRGVVIIGGGSYVLQYLIMSSVKSIPIIWAAGILQGFGYTLCGTALVYAVLPSFFKNRIATMAGICTSSTGLANFVIIPFLRQWESAYGYTVAMRREALIIAIATVISAVCITYHKNDPILGENAGELKRKGVGETFKEYGRMFKEMLGEPMLICFVLMFFIIGGISSSLTSTYTLVGPARGVAVEVAAAALALHNLMIVIGKLVSGAAVDKFKVLPVATVLCILTLSTIFMIQWGPTSMYRYACVGSGLGASFNQNMAPLLLMACMGKKYNAGYLGTLLAIFSVGRLFGVPLIQVSYDMSGSYAGTMIVWAALYILALVLMYVANGMKGGYAKKHELDQPEAAAEA